MKFNNPIISGAYPDPSICRVNNDYYLVNSSFGYFPGLPVFHSQDLVNWRQIGYGLTRESQVPLLSSEGADGPLFSYMGIYAPTIRFHNGRFYIVTTNTVGGRNFIIQADKPEGPWSEPLYLDQWGGIDPSLLFDEDGKVYITGTGSHKDAVPGVYQAEINPATGDILTERRLIWEGTGGCFPEGPHLYPINGFYYLVIAEGGTEYGHMVTVARSGQPYGPFEACPYNPVLSHRSTSHPVQATGHADLVQAHDGSWWTVLLGIRPVGYPFHHHLGRETYLAPVTWTEDGWPVIGEQGRVDAEMEGPGFFAGYDPALSRFGRDDFDREVPGFQWNFYKNPPEHSYSLSERESCLTLYGTEYTLDDSQQLAFAGRRQQDFDCVVSAQLLFDPGNEGEEAGLTVYMNEKAHYEIGVRRNSGQRTLFLRRRIGSLVKVEWEKALEASEVILNIRADSRNYSFSYSLAGQEEVTIGSGECSYVATEVAGGFTGVFFGMYATGNGRPSQSPAHFEYFDYIQKEMIQHTMK
ncbi:glycoside hydrolase family 43 protein [Paenibacillus sp. MMS20-IR301]|uniref:glycoside hydrolase family 43 protein n=1 Tax=Paenibacillus sp. MMS20-IR301 TaxID=2895946 RepID=UPI0028E4C338|nr:glycoside hydrolase family 43 protein [Paenibacillus sp. MMS20-IR301]WNS46087.1 glycoside hydrolase family 43 protein [Paenibacillus sp. MMS20-IR301]